MVELSTVPGSLGSMLTLFTTGAYVQAYCAQRVLAILPVCVLYFQTCVYRGVFAGVQASSWISTTGPHKCSKARQHAHGWH